MLAISDALIEMYCKTCIFVHDSFKSVSRYQKYAQEFIQTWD